MKNPADSFAIARRRDVANTFASLHIEKLVLTEYTILFII